MNPQPLTRMHRLKTAHPRLLVKATVLLFVCSIAVALLPFRKAIRFGSVATGVRGATTAADCVRSVERAARRLPWRLVCIHKGLAAQRILRAHGFDAVLHYGVRHHPLTRNLEAHVWVTIDGTPVVGGTEAPQFAAVSAYP